MPLGLDLSEPIWFKKKKIINSDIIKGFRVQTVKLDTTINVDKVLVYQQMPKM